jgi:hypothetical protein
LAPTPEQERTQRAFEALIGAAAPALDALLRFGERVSRLAEPKDHEYYPVHSLAGPEEDPVPGSTPPREPPGAADGPPSPGGAAGA